MSGQKYKRTNFDDDENTSTAGTPPGVTYDPAIAFKAGASFWQRRTGLERLLLVLTVLLLLTVLILACVLGARSPHPASSGPVYGGAPSHHAATNGKGSTSKGSSEKAVCLTPACVTVASSVITAMNRDVKPCDDFYEFACGGWIKSHPIPSGQSRWGTFGVMWKENQLVMKNSLEQPLNTSTSTAETKARQYYRSCMDEDKLIEKMGDKPLQDLLRDLGGWNISTRSGPWSPADFDFQQQLHRLHGLGLSVFFNTWVGEDEKNVSTNILQFDQDGLALAREQYLNKSIRDDKTLSAYLKFMVDIGELLGGDRNETEDQMLRVIELEQKIANVTTPPEDRRDDMKLYHKMSLAELTNKAPFVDWHRYANHLMSKRSTPLELPPSERIVVYAPEFLANISALIRDMLRTDEGKNTLNNYMMWHLSKFMASYLSKPFRDAKKEFTEVLSGVTGYEESWRYCTTDADSTLGFALGAMFVREAFNGDSKKKAALMIQEIKDAFKRNLPLLEWMDDATRNAAIEKANAVIDKIGFPKYILNQTALDERYEKLVVKEDEYFNNNVRDLRYVMTRNMDKYRKAPDLTSWSMTPPTVNAYYTPTKNEIVFPAGILQAPFYSSQYPKSLNFGGMGVVMGHELTHGFDDSGREYDKTGMLRPWWNNDSVTRFKERAQCMTDQYSAYTVNEDHVKGKQTLGENIADNGGLKSAYNAYLDWVRTHGAEAPLPGLQQFSHNQLFFIAFAQVWCSNTKPQSEHMAILTDPHSPARFRVIGPLSNSKEFSRLFKCAKNSPMNPDKKCEVW